MYNYSATPITAFADTFPAQSIVLNSFSGDESPVGWPSIRFTAPSAGAYNLSVSWQDASAGGPADRGVQMWLNDSGTGWTQLSSGGTGGTYAPSTPLELSSGQTITLVAATAPGRTVANMTFTAVPEPGTLGLLGLGSAGLAAMAWRKRK